MILYFADRQLNILGQASTRLQKGVKFESDTKIESIETGVATFECYVLFNSDTRAKVEAWAEVGNYILSKSDGENKLYCIIDSEIDTKKGRAYVYAEDDGLDLLNEIVEPYAADRYYPISHYIGMYATSAGWEIGINEVEGLTRQLSFDNEQTASARLLNIAESFNNCELSFSFDIKGLKVAKKYINIYEKRGNDTGIQLRLNKEIDNIIITKSIANIATALRCTGGTLEDAEKPITLEGYTYDDGDFYVEGAVLKSRKALEKWRRYLWKADTEQLGGHIVKQFSFDTTSQEVLCENAIAKLKKICDMEVNYEADITKFPEKVRIGDRVNIIDDKGSLYLSSRVLTLETSVADNVKCAVLGEHLIKKSGISAKVEELANQFSELAESRVFYTWVAYADDENGTGISLNPAGKDYLGIAANKLKKTVDISDPSIFEWSKIKGEKGEQGEPGISGVDGTSVIAVLEQYYLSTSSTECMGGYWQTTLPEWSSGHYIWERKAVTWSDGLTTYTDPVLNSALNHANEAAEFAQQQANTAAQSASSAQQSAANADTAAQEAANKASQAESLAQTASGTAAQAKSEAEAAQEAADRANADIVQINNEIADVRKEVTEGLETLTDTMSADYAKKTDLTDVQGSLQTQISKNAASIETTAKSVEDVKIDASNAVANANEAKETATTAQNTANTAKAEAEAAQTAADSATQAAQTARNEATAAQTAAEKAETAAENAQAVADAADKDLQTAKANLEAVTNRVGATEGDIAAAQEAVNAAQAAADEAKADSVAAQSAATQAKSTADIAKANADAAQAAASQAQTDADNAKTAADKAQSDADKALADLATMGNRVTEAETKITQNSAAIQAAATKQEVTQQLNGYYTKTEADAKFNITAEYVSSTVKTEVESVKIGGRNLLLNSATKIPTSNGGATITAETGIEVEEWHATDAVRIYGTSGTSGLFGYMTGLSGDSLSISEQPYIFSVYVKNLHASSAVTVTSNGLGTESGKIEPGEAKRIVLSGVSNGRMNAQFNFAVPVAGNGFDIVYWHPKIEIGNKVTDWSPAPEDMATADELSEVDTTANDAKTKAESAQSAIAQLSDSFNVLVSNNESGSFLKQDASGNWYFTSAETEAEMAKIAEALATLDGATEATLDEIKAQLNELSKLSNYIRLSTDGEQPSIELGQKDSDYRIVITNTDIKYYFGSIELAVFDPEGLKADKVIVRKELNAVGVVFRKKSNGYVGVGLF